MRIPNTLPQNQFLEPSLVAPRGQALPESGAGDGNRTQGKALPEPEKKRFRANADAKCD